MPIRKQQLITNQFYHVFNKTINKEPIFLSKKTSMRFIESINFYHYKNPPIKFSNFYNLKKSLKENILLNLEFNNKKIVEIIAYCLMPNHFHFLIKQKEDNGISIFMANLQNSFSRYYNLKTHREGPLFSGRFKSVLIKTEEELLHVFRYIHLNPYSGYLFKQFNQLFYYPWSSFTEYIENKKGICDKEIIYKIFNNNLNQIIEFHKNQADYQRNLEKIKNLIHE